MLQIIAIFEWVKTLYMIFVNDHLYAEMFFLNFQAQWQLWKQLTWATVRANFLNILVVTGNGMSRHYTYHFDKSLVCYDAWD